MKFVKIQSMYINFNNVILFFYKEKENKLVIKDIEGGYTSYLMTDKEYQFLLEELEEYCYV